jgi:hypothetical protein
VVVAVCVGCGTSSWVAALELEVSFKGGTPPSEVHVWGGRELQACVMPHHSGGGGKKQYALCHPLLEREPLPDLALLRRCRVKLSGVAWLFTRTNGWCTPQRRRREHRAGEGQ